MIIREFLNTAFYSFDYNILKAMHVFAENGGLTIKPFVKFFHTYGNNVVGYLTIMIVIFFVLKNKKYSYLFALSFALSVIFNNLIIKGYVARIRPFMVGIEDYKIWWQYAGKVAAGGYSFVSGHTIRAVASFYSMYIENKNKQYLIFVILFSFFTVLSRLLFILHYPSDCLFGIILGIGIAYLSHFIITKIQDKLDFIAKKIFPFAFKV